MNTFKTFSANLVDDYFKTMHSARVSPRNGRGGTSAYNCDVDVSCFEKWLAEYAANIDIKVYHVPAIAALWDWTKNNQWVTNNAYSSQKLQVSKEGSGEDVPFRFGAMTCIRSGRMDPVLGDAVKDVVNITLGITIEKAFLPPLIAQFVVDFSVDIERDSVNDPWRVVESAGTIRAMEFIRSVPLPVSNGLTDVVHRFAKSACFDQSILDVYNK